MDLAHQRTVCRSRADAPHAFPGFLAGTSLTGGPDVFERTVRDPDKPAADPRLNGIDVADVPGATRWAARAATAIGAR
jgi:hypothetical protein